MAGPLMNQLVASAVERFEQRYACAPRWVVAAPGRVNLIGEHIDYNAGFVLPMAIDRYCVIAAGNGPNASSSTAEVFSAATDEEFSVLLPVPPPNASRGHWSNYIAGVVAGYAERGMRPGPFRAVIESSVPVGGGLSSSAAIEVATATLIEAMTGFSLAPAEKALLCQKAEHAYAGVPCGIMDQFASVMCLENHLMLLDCRAQKVEQLPLADPDVTLLIMNTNVKHELSGSEYAERRGQCESSTAKLGVASLRDVTLEQLELQRERLDTMEYRRARHVISEMERTAAAAEAVRGGNWKQVGQLMYASHDSLRNDYDVSCPELDLLVDLARDLGARGGVIGSRMTGGGFGGCTVSLVETARLTEVAQHLASNYREQTGIEPAVITSRPARGAHVVTSP